MILPKMPANEAKRLSSLYEYHLLDTPPEKEYDDITRIASQICEMPISTITLVDDTRQWFKSDQGMGFKETPRELAFCAHAIVEPDKVMVVNDSLNDIRFHDHPDVVGGIKIGFYAGVPLVNADGYALGTLCVVDHKANHLSEVKLEALKALANQVVTQFEMRKRNIELSKQKASLEAINKELERFAFVVAHDLKSPCNNLIGLSSLIKQMYGDKLDAEGNEMLDMLTSASTSLKSIIDGTLHHAHLVNTIELEKQEFTFGSLAQELKLILNIPPGFSFEYSHGDVELFLPRHALTQVLINLCVNAIKYNDKEHGALRLYVEDEGHQYRFFVKDNGPGIPEAYFTRIFEIFQTLGRKDRYNNNGQGIGLSTVKRLVDNLGGEITVESTVGQGSTFSFTVSK